MKQRGLRAPALAGAADDAEGVILLPDQRDGDVDLAHAKPKRPVAREFFWPERATLP